MSALYPDCTIKELPPNTDLTSRCEPIEAHDLKNGHWCIDSDKSGCPGVVEGLKMSKTGKHGHAKFTYRLRMPHSGRTASCMHPGGDHLFRPVMEKKEYQFSYKDEDNNVFAFGEDMEEMQLQISPERADVFEKLNDCIQEAESEQKDIFLTVLEGPRKIGDTIEILQIIQDCKVVNPQ